MRPSHSARHGGLAGIPGALLVGLALFVALPGDVVPHPTAHTRARVKDYFGADCLTSVTGSTAVAQCHNPYPGTDRLRLHIECRRWWDVDSDGTPVEAGPAMSVRLTGRCWKEIGAVWVSHQR